jgi:hypothetical protein
MPMLKAPKLAFTLKPGGIAMVLGAVGQEDAIVHEQRRQPTWATVRRFSNTFLTSFRVSAVHGIILSHAGNDQLRRRNRVLHHR